MIIPAAQEIIYEAFKLEEQLIKSMCLISLAPTPENYKLGGMQDISILLLSSLGRRLEEKASVTALAGPGPSGGGRPCPGILGLCRDHLLPRQGLHFPTTLLLTKGSSFFPFEASLLDHKDAKWQRLVFTRHLRLIGESEEIWGRKIQRK